MQYISLPLPLPLPLPRLGIDSDSEVASKKILPPVVPSFSSKTPTQNSGISQSSLWSRIKEGLAKIVPALVVLALVLSAALINDYFKAAQPTTRAAPVSTPMEVVAPKPPPVRVGVTPAPEPLIAVPSALGIDGRSTPGPSITNSATNPSVVPPVRTFTPFNFEVKERRFRTNMQLSGVPVRAGDIAVLVDFGNNMATIIVRRGEDELVKATVSTRFLEENTE